MPNTSLNKAGKAKKDEFYTQLTDIEKELKHYQKHFKDKIVLCNCDDPYESNFFKYFVLKFNDLKLKKIICTCYNGSPFANTELELFPQGTSDRKAYKIEIDKIEDLNNDGTVNLEDVQLLLKKTNIVKELKGNGDFCSEECIDFLKQADIVVTNPPFSLFREYVAQLMKYDKKFIIIGNMNAITYKEIFPLIKNNKIWLGVSGIIKQGYKVPDSYELYGKGCYTNEKGEKFIKMGNTIWYTNLEHSHRNEKMILFRNYTPEEYPKYDNYDAIEVSKTCNIPMDYDGVMGVPISFLDKYNPNQFEILGITENSDIVKKFYIEGNNKYDRPYINGKRKYSRILIRRKK